MSDMMTAFFGTARSKGKKMTVNKGAVNDAQTKSRAKLPKGKGGGGPSGGSDTTTAKKQVMGIFS